MAGVKGRSGGPRKNSGGARPGAGRKPNPPTLWDAGKNYRDPKRFLVDLMNQAEIDVKLRADAAKALMPYVHGKIGEGGKKEKRQAAAKKAAGKFQPMAAPKLATSGGKRVA